MFRERSLTTASLFLIGTLIAQGSSALEYSYTIFSSAQQSDNITQLSQRQISVAADGEQKGTILNTGIQFGLGSEQSLALKGNLSGNISRTFYSIEELDPQTNKSLVASFQYEPRTSNFRLSGYNSIQQVPVDRTNNQTVNNIADISVYAIVPSYFIKVSATSELLTDFTYTKVDDEQTRNSREVKSTSLAYVHQLNSILSGSLNAVRTNTLFLNSDIEFDQDFLFFRLEKEKGITQFVFDIGSQKIVDTDLDSIVAYSLSLSRRASANSKLVLSYSQGYSDPLETDVSNNVNQLGSSDQVAFVNGLVKEKGVSADFNYNVRYFEWQFKVFGGSLESEDLIGNPGTNEKHSGSALSGSYRFYSRKNDALSYGLSGGVGYEKKEFIDLGLENTVKSANVRLNYFATQHLTAFFEILSRNADGSGPESNLDEHRVSIGFEWTPRGRLEF